MTPPNREAMVYDLKVLKSLGVNMVRKHVSLTLKNKYLQNSKTSMLTVTSDQLGQGRTRPVLPSL